MEEIKLEDINKEIDTKSDNLTVLTGFIMLLIPLILITFSGAINESISLYVYSCPIVFSSLLSIGAWTYFTKGFVSAKSKFDIVIGLSLFGVIFTPCNDYFVAHYIFATIFFLGNTFNMIYFSNKKHLPYKIIFGSVVIVSMAFHFIFGMFNLFVAEWIGLLPMTVNYVLEGLGLTE
jgi:hypothetical protein